MPLTQATAQLLFTKQAELAQIKWTDGEANTDSGYSKLTCMCCSEVWASMKELYPECNDYSITCESPDVSIKFWKDSKVIFVAKIELKSGKAKGIIPGSTILKLDINQPVIFCLRNESERTFKIRYGQYSNCINESDIDTFQDRSPRPFVNFNKMTEIDTPLEYSHKDKSDWITHYAKCALFRIKECYQTWQDRLVNAILNQFIKETSIEEFIKLKSKLS